MQSTALAKRLSVCTSITPRTDHRRKKGRIIMRAAQIKTRRLRLFLAAGADYLLLHICMGAAVAASVAYAWIVAGPAAALLWLSDEIRYYFPYFTLLAILLPGVFHMAGFYRS